MTQDEIIEMAASAGIIPWTKHEYIGGKNFSASDEGLDGDAASLIQFAKLVAAKERKALEAELLKLKQGVAANSDYIQGRWDLIGEFQDVIRARGEQ